MPLDPDLLKLILLWGEDHLPDEKKSWLASEIAIKKYTKSEIIFHVKLLNDNGYLECQNVSDNKKQEYFINNLTLNGYQYLELLRSKAWNTAKNLMHEIGVIFAESAIRAVIQKYA
ncbi:MAG: DUF2513 domain-containing protein [Anaerolineaceae bacterium]